MSKGMSKVLEDSTRGGFYLTVGSLLSTMISALAVFIVARELGSELYGLYTVSTVVPSLLFLFVDPGIRQGILKFSASLRMRGEKGRLGNLLLHSLLFKTVLGFTASLICFILSDVFAANILRRPEVGGFIRISSALILFQTIFGTVNSAFTGLDKTEYNALTTFVQATVRAIVAPVLVILGFSIAGALAGYVLGYVAAGLLGVCLFILKVYRPLNRSDDSHADFLSDLTMLIRYGFPLYISVLIGGFITEYRNILLAIFTSNYEIGNFHAALNFGVVIHGLSLPIATALVPAFSKLEEREEAMKEFFNMSVKYTSMIILPVSILLMFYSEEMVQVVYGRGYELAPTFLLLYVTTYFLVGLGSVVMVSSFDGIGKTRVSLKIALVQASTQIFLAPVLTWLLKVNGMILTIVFSSLAGTLYGLYVAKKLLGIVASKKVLRIYLVSFVSAAPLLLVELLPVQLNMMKIIVGAAAYLAVYFLMVPVAKLVDSREIQEMKRIAGKIRPLGYFAQPILSCEERILLKISSNRCP